MSTKTDSSDCSTACEATPDPGPPRAAVRRVWARFTGEPMLRESGRLPFAVLHPFVQAGCEVVLEAGLRERLIRHCGGDPAGLPPTAQLSLSMPGLRLAAGPPADPRGWLYLHDQPGGALARQPWQRRVRVAADTFGAYPLRQPLIAPYGMHPAQALRATPALLQPLRGTVRTVRLLFAGDARGYVRNRVCHPAPKLPRREVLDTLLRGLPPGSVLQATGAPQVERACQAGGAPRFVLSESGEGIPAERWLPTLARADFFLCPPGMVMPLCHNVVEAMAVGTIPLIGYPEWLQPPLRHMVDCVAYGDHEDLLAQARRVLQMPRAQIERMRAAVIEYHDRHLRPEALVRAIEARPERDLTLLIHTELNTARHARRLGAGSVLMRGAQAGGPLRWLGRLLDGRALSGPPAATPPGA